MYKVYARKEWIGMAELPSIKAGTFVNITLPYAMGNRSGSLVEFCSEKAFRDSKISIIFHDAARAILRYNYFNSKKNKGNGWNYPSGSDDFLRYQNFATRWVPGVLRALRDNERKKIVTPIEKHVASARALAIFKEKDTHRERLDKLLSSQANLVDSFPVAACDTVSTQRLEQLNQWEVLQENWRKLLCSNDHGLEGDLAITALKKALKAPLSNTINQAVERSRFDLKKVGDMLVSLFDDCITVDDYTMTLQSLESLIKKLRTNDKYPTNDSVLTSRTLLSNIKRIYDASYFEQVIKIASIQESSEAEKQWQILNELDGDKVGLMNKVFENWNAVFNIVLPSLQTENSMWGGERVKETKQSIDSLISSLNNSVELMQGDSNDDA